MALFKILKGNESNLPAKKTEGYAYFTEDKGNFFVDVSSSKRMQLNASHAQYDLEEFTSPTGQNSAKLPIHEKYLRNKGGVVDGNITADTFIGVHKGNILGVTETEPTSVTSYSPLFINTGGSAANATTEYSRRANQDFNIRMLQGTASAAGYTVLDLGNATATGTAGNKYGAIKLFSEKTGSVTLKSNTASTSNVTATFPAYSGNVTISTTSAQNPTSATTYNIPFYVNNSNRVSYNDGLRYNTIEGTASALGQSNLYLGNSTASGVAKNKYGCIFIYGQNANYTRLRARQTPAFNQSTFYLPAGDGANDACYAIWSPNEATAVGSATQPVYIAANGKAVACTAYSGGTAVTLNGTSKAGSTASIYTPTAAGTNGQILASTGGAPGWVNQSTIAAGTAAKLANTRAINGTNFDGTADITTAKWGTARTISISGTAGTTGTSINGSANATLSVPATMSGFTKITSTSFVGALTGNADTATKLKTARTINGTSFNGSANITTAKWGTARTVSISSTAGTTGTSVNGSANVSLVIPKTMTGFTSITSTTFVGALNGNATSSTTATKFSSARTIALTGDVSGTASADGSSGWSISTTVADNSHNHGYLSGWADTRSAATAPNDYNGQFKVVGIKQKSLMDIDGSAYSSLIGFRGWSDSSGGNAHELAFTGNGNLYHRQGSTTTWSSWNRIPMCGTDNTFSGTNTFSGQVVLSRTTDADGTTDAKPALRIGDVSGIHLEFDGNEIMSKNSGTTVGPLYLNNNGGLVSIGSGGLQVNGTSKFLGDITLNDSTVNIVRTGITQSWYQGRNSAMIRTTSYSGYDAILSMKTTAGDWSLGVYNDNKMYFTYILDSNYNANTNTATAQIRFDPDGNISATKFTGNGAGLTSLNASNISTGTLAAARLPNHASTATTYGVGDATHYGHVILYPAASCTSYTSDSGGACTPAAVKKAVELFSSGGAIIYKVSG